MTKQEEIREGMALRLHTDERALLRVVDEVSPCNCMWEELPEYWKNHYRDRSTDLMKYQHSQGVVIKVDGKLPKEYDGERGREAYTNGQQDMLKAGYVAWEPLIEEPDDHS